MAEVQKGVTATLRFPEAEADPVALSGPTVTVVRDSDGATIIDGASATSHEEDEYFTFDLAGSEIPEVDLLTVTWADENSSIEQKVEVVGGFACSVAAIKNKLESDEEDLPDEALIVQEREKATRDIEAACWDAFRHRYEKETLSGDNGKVLVLNKRRVVKILSLEIDEVLMSPQELKEFAITDIGIQRRLNVGTGPIEQSGAWAYSDWLEGTMNITVAYVYGHDNFPSAANPVRDLTADYLVKHPTDWEERATSYTDTDGNNYRLVTPGERGKRSDMPARFSIPSVNAFVASNSTARML